MLYVFILFKEIQKVFGKWIYLVVGVCCNGGQVNGYIIVICVNFKSSGIFTFFIVNNLIYKGKSGWVLILSPFFLLDK